MSMEVGGRISFHTALIGYQKSEVEEYVTRIQSELENQEAGQKKWEQQMEELQEEVKRLNIILDSERSEKQELQEKQSESKRKLEELQEELQENQSESSRKVEELQEQLKETDEKYASLQNEYEEYRRRMEADGVDPKIIQDAILNAQRMSDIVIVEAQQKALEIREIARKERRQQEEEGRQIVEEARTEASRVTEEAELKCENLQKEYDRILLDVTGFKAELMKMYRKHMELLAALPQKEIVEIENTAD